MNIAFDVKKYEKKKIFFIYVPIFVFIDPERIYKVEKKNENISRYLLFLPPIRTEMLKTRN